MAIRKGDYFMVTGVPSPLPNRYVDTFNQIADREHGNNPIPEIWNDRNLTIEMDDKILCDLGAGAMYLEGIDEYVPFQP